MSPLEPWPEMVNCNGEPEAVECRECGAEGYRHPKASLFLCRGCWGDLVREFLDRDEDTAIGRLDALERLSRHDSFPVEDPEEGDRLILSAVVGRGPEKYLKEITHLVEGDCPRCGYDRAGETYRSMYTEFTETTTCRACGFLIDERGSL